jgi:hypothetical protein
LFRLFSRRQKSQFLYIEKQSLLALVSYTLTSLLSFLFFSFHFLSDIIFFCQSTLLFRRRWCHCLPSLRHKWMMGGGDDKQQQQSLREKDLWPIFPIEIKSLCIYTYFLLSILLLSYIIHRKKNSDWVIIPLV